MKFLRDEFPPARFVIVVHADQTTCPGRRVQPKIAFNRGSTELLKVSFNFKFQGTGLFIAYDSWSHGILTHNISPLRNG